MLMCVCVFPIVSCHFYHKVTILRLMIPQRLQLYLPSLLSVSLVLGCDSSIHKDGT